MTKQELEAIIDFLLDVNPPNYDGTAIYDSGCGCCSDIHTMPPVLLRRIAAKAAK